MMMIDQMEIERLAKEINQIVFDPNQTTSYTLANWILERERRKALPSTAPYEIKLSEARLLIESYERTAQNFQTIQGWEKKYNEAYTLAQKLHQAIRALGPHQLRWLAGFLDGVDQLDGVKDDEVQQKLRRMAAVFAEAIASGISAFAPTPARPCNPKDHPDAAVGKSGEPSLTHGQ